MNINKFTQNSIVKRLLMIMAIRSLRRSICYTH